jgi:undecaprenyl-diphosphatase
MMIFFAVIMGIVEGITEFLPVSSTGHLIIMSEILGFEGPPGKVFEISIQLGAILAICCLFRDKLWGVASQILRARSAQLFTLNIALAFVPAGLLGFFFHHIIMEHLFDIRVVATTLILGGFAMLAIERYKPAPRVLTTDDISLKQALLIGLCQSVAMIPGVSRSGATIMGALLLGVDRKAAAEFSFFLAIPTIFIATFYDLYKHRDSLTTDGITLIAVGFVTAFISAFVVVRWFIGFISTHDFKPFAIYRIFLGIVVWLVLIMR